MEGSSTQQPSNGTTQPPSTNSYDVIISGAGPVGLFLACELAMRKCSVLVLEKADDPHSDYKVLPFGLRGLNSISIEAFDRRGMYHEFEVQKKMMAKMGAPPPTSSLAGNKEVKPAGNPVRGPGGGGAGFFGGSNSTTNPDTTQWKYRLGGSTDTKLMSELREVETILHRRAATLGVVVKYGAAVTGFQQTVDGVTVQAARNQSFSGRYLVGCDGSRSAVRKLGGFEYVGTEPEFTGYSTSVELADGEKLQPGRVMTPVGLYWQLFPGYVIMQDFDGGAAHKPGHAVTQEQVQEVLRRISQTDVTISKLHKANTWTDRTRQAATYRNGRVFLAGDAAHIHSPLGGQGMNLGLGDAMNLGWKLAATLHHTAPDGLLDTYYTERHPIGARVLDWSRAQIATMLPNPAARAMAAIMRDLINTRDGATYLSGRLSGVLTHYASMRQGGEQHALVGYSVPNFELEDGRKVGELLRDGSGLLLDFTASDTLQSIASEHGEHIKYVAGKAKEQLGLSAVLVRPDGIVAWAADSEADEKAVRQAAAAWWSQSAEAAQPQAQQAL